ncbi:hypothetical protein B0H17DRAFT_1126544 [Mycena rosella]|uniref:Uncharacterized protein n=1 Tax=Mycena rosella TaxID=1033263 RepID=A0AAD7M7K1_MYCRO|nr:hypothetical protein B0H17DRAFT_1126544 [Mycena rosella]
MTTRQGHSHHIRPYHHHIMDFMLYEPFDFSSSRYASPSIPPPALRRKCSPLDEDRHDVGRPTKLVRFPDYKVARPKRYSRRSARATSISISFVDNPSSSRPFLIPPIFRRWEEECLFCNGERFQIPRNVPTSSPFPANAPVKDNLRISSPPPLPTPMELDVDDESASIYPPIEQDSASPAAPAPGTWESLCAASRSAKYDDLAVASRRAELRSKGKGKERDAGAEASASNANASTSTSVGTGHKLTTARAISTIVSKVSTRSSGSSEKKPIEKADGKKPAGKSRPIKTATGHGKCTALANLSNVHHPRAPSASVASSPVKTSAPPASSSSAPALRKTPLRDISRFALWQCMIASFLFLFDGSVLSLLDSIRGPNSPLTRPSEVPHLGLDARIACLLRTLGLRRRDHLLKEIDGSNRLEVSVVHAVFYITLDDICGKDSSSSFLGSGVVNFDHGRNLAQFWWKGVWLSQAGCQESPPSRSHGMLSAQIYKK